MFSPNDGRIAPATDENIEAARKGDQVVNFDFLTEPRRDDSSSNAHPLTGTSQHFMLFDWFHQENCKQLTEILRRSSLVEQLAGRVNTQAAEQLHVTFIG